LKLNKIELTLQQQQANPLIAVSVELKSRQTHQKYEQIYTGAYYIVMHC
jgi:hypothetical protein